MTLSLLVVLLSAFQPAACAVNGHRLAGRVRIVDVAGDVRVRKVSMLPDLAVVWRGSMATRCGEWTRVTAHEDFTVQWVTASADVRVQFVSNFPGAR